ncbi:MAG: SpoIIE family protein phosphatase, partial [Bacillota bacterium]|nr:SpoIIE family protein phosphatase [Bacillota bacterium]
MTRRFDKKSIIIFAVSLIAFLALAIPFRDLLRINYATEVRPAAVLNTVLGIFFGMPAILATTFGNIILDIQSGVPIVEIIAYIIPQFLYGFVAYFLWQKINKQNADSKSIDGMPKIISFIIATIAASLTLAVAAGLEVGFFNKNIDLLIDFIVFAFSNNAVMNLFLGFPLIIALDKFVNKKRITLCGRYLLVSFALETIFVATIIGVNCHMNADVGITDLHFWEKIDFMCMGAILFVIGITIVIIALKLDKELKEQNYDINVASTIQLSMLPTKFDLKDERLEIFAFMRTAKIVGGDFYDFYYIDKNHLAFIIADVSGKGIPAALFMMRSSSTIRNYA